MTPEICFDNYCDLALLKVIEVDPDVSQAALAVEMGISIGPINGLLREMVASGLIEVKRASRRKLRYIITAEGRPLQTIMKVNGLEISIEWP